VELVVSDDHAGLRAAIREVLPEAAWQRCYVHFLRNALDHLPRKADDECMTELRWIYDRRTIEEAHQDLARFSHENPGSGQIWIWRGSIQDVVTHDVNLLIVLGIDQRSFALR
jgi:transposase-like protein